MVVTQRDAPFDGVLWTSYEKACGPRPSHVIYIESDGERSAARKAVESLLLFQPTEVLRLVSARQCGRPLVQADAERGLHRSLSQIWADVAETTVGSLNSDRGLSILDGIAPDVLLSVGAPEIFEPRVLKVARIASINVHNGRLPSYRGRFATFWERWEDEKVGAVTVHEMVSEVDAGQIVAEAQVEMASTLFETLVHKKRLGGELLADVLSRPEECLCERTEGLASAGSAPGPIYSWPTLGQMLRHRLE